MKKLILIFAVFSLATAYSSAQDDYESDLRDKLHIGLKAGINYSNVFDEQAEEFHADGKLGFVGGIFLTIPIGIYLGIQPEVLFSQKGFQADGRILTFDYEASRTSNFIDVPVLVQFKPFSFLSLMAGPQFSYLVSQKDEFHNYSEEQVFENDNLRKNTLCFLGGVDINFDQFVLGGRIGWDIQHNKGDGTSISPRYKNVWYQATVGFRFYD